MMPGETIASGAPDVCRDCKVHLVNKVLLSNAGWYIGTICNCGPYSRESGYYASVEEARKALEDGGFERY